LGVFPNPQPLTPKLYIARGREAKYTVQRLTDSICDPGSDCQVVRAVAAGTWSSPHSSATAKDRHPVVSAGFLSEVASHEVITILIRLGRY
jgi:hypothetical protein